MGKVPAQYCGFSGGPLCQGAKVVYVHIEIHEKGSKLDGSDVYKEGCGILVQDGSSPTSGDVVSG